MEQNLTQYVDTLFTNMENFTQKDGLIGKPVIQGDKTFLPIMSVTLGYGGGDSQSKGKAGTTAQSTGGMNNSMGGGAMGLGAKLSADAIIVIDKDNVLMAPVGAQGNISQVIDKIPQIIGNMNQNQGGQQQQQQQQQQQTPGQGSWT